ncbi:PREDICTED: uridine 5'-monophosphate synthase-like [Amphimedon queenslandica]|uniref:Uridine 5'-monophosphate synthase n=1 Tax=Amphimedon queenslandica TaxID=400682 RepID=A0A1X7ULD7_AMPQE|nr:PREDICTED: uridine 5'-monophosphate synthase-like [Amphimedon queenslandica]|eukprot:XP_019853579.1 PREDICTED: uridine 5'-monophosphate synthase-like [Amphimedon queenslandica]
MAAESEDRLEALIEDLLRINAIKFGSFKLKSGVDSPIYFDLRVIVSYPKILGLVADLLWSRAQSEGISLDCICGVPYTALPFATVVSVKYGVPMVMRRKEAKDYGTKRMVEGSWLPGSDCLLFEDVVTTGSSVLETVEVLKTAGLEVKNTIVLLNREQGGSENLASRGIQLYSVLSVYKVLDVLLSKNKIDLNMAERVRGFLNGTTPDSSLLTTPITTKIKKRLRYSERRDIASHKAVKRLLSIMEKKKTNLALSADLTTTDKLIKLVDEVGPHVCLVKTHVDIMSDFSYDGTGLRLKELAKKHNFMIMEDRKFSDIGNTCKLQYTSPLYSLSDWSDLVTCHGIAGPGTVNALSDVIPEGSGCVLVAEMSSRACLTSSEYKESVLRIARDFDNVIGLICQRKLSEREDILYMTPGVNIDKEGDRLGQQYHSPEEVIIRKESDIIIVGRGIYESADPVASAIQYKNRSYSAYTESITIPEH